MLSVNELCKTYANEITAMQNITFTAESGVFGLLGPNGAGKSTLMRTLATLQLPDSGSAQLNNIDLIGEPTRARQVIGYLPQEMGVYPRVTAREMLEYLAKLKGLGDRVERQKHVATQLERVNLTNDADRRLDGFSGGMKRRFGIAAAFLGSPKLVIVDEPTAGLDPYERRHFQLLLSEAARECVLLLSSHIVEDLAGLCQHMALLDRGKIVLSGAPQKLVQDLDGQVWEFTTRLEAPDDLHQSHRVLSWRPWQGRLRVRVWSEHPPTLDSNLLITEGVQPVAPDLEDLYAFHVNREDQLRGNMASDRL